MTRESVYKAIDSERMFQDRKWGTIAQHPHEVGAWLTIMRVLLAKAEEAYVSSAHDDAALTEIRKLAGTAVACMEQHGVRERFQHIGGDSMRMSQP